MSKETEKPIYIRADEQLKKRFDELRAEGLTSVQVLEKLIDLNDEVTGQQKYLDINSHIKLIESNFSSIKAEIDKIKVEADRWQENAKAVYVDFIGGELKALKGEIEFDQELRDRIKEFENKIEELKKEKLSSKDKLETACVKIKDLEDENKELVKKNSDLVLQINDVKTSNIEDTKKIIELETKLQMTTEQYESTVKELTELREIKYKCDEVSKELATIKNSKDNKLKAKDDEITKLKAQLKAKDDEIEKLKSTKTETKTKNSTK